MTRHTDRIAKLEQRLNSRPDPRIAEEARERLVRGVLGVIAAIEAGNPPNNPIGHALVEFDFDVVAALTALVERRRRGEALSRS